MRKIAVMDDFLNSGHKELIGRAAARLGFFVDYFARAEDALPQIDQYEIFFGHDAQAILADPHCGAFAVIRLCSYFVAMLGLCAAVEPTPAAGLCMGAAFTLERALSGLAVTSFPMAKNTGLAHAFASAADRRRVRGGLAVLSVLLSLFLVWQGGALAAAAAWLVFWHYHHTAIKQFGGISGDLAGWFVQRAELWMLAALVAGQVLWGWTL